MAKNPHADFSPTMLGYTGQGAFRFWCQMALPLTYDDSLSYYELLNKVVTYLNNTKEDVANVETNVDALSNAYNQLQKYVNDYFDDLDVEEELRNVLDKMALDGSLDEILTPLVEAALPDIVDDKIGNVVADQIGDVVAEQIPDVVENQLPPLVEENVPGVVTDWLDDNVDPVGSAVIVDNTLSISGAAGDAKVTGDEINNLKTQLNRGKTATPGYILTATDEGNGTEWSPVGLPTDAQTAEAVSNWLDEHPEATTTVQDASLTEAKFADALKAKVDVVITTETEFVTALSENTYEEYVCGEIAINTPIMLSTDKLGNKKRFVNGTFTLNDTMFTSSSAGSVREIPAFTNCTFIGNGNAICDEGFYSQYGIFVNCIFIDCAFVNNGKLIQSVHFIGCKVVNTTIDFITTGRIIDARFDHVIVDNDNTHAFLKAGHSYYPSDIDAHISATNVSFAHFMVEGQSVTPIEVCDCNISFTDLYTEALANGLIKINDSALQNSRLNLYFLNCRLQAQSGVYVVNINSSDYDNARDTAVTVRSCVVNNSEFINKTNFRIYNTDNVAPINNGHFIPSKELSGIKSFSNNTRNSVVTFKPVTADGQTTYHAVVRKFPCLFDVKFQFNSPTRVISLLFFVDKYSDSYYQCDCLNNNPNLSYTTSIDQDGNVDIQFEKAWFTASNTFGMFLMGQENILSIENYYRSQFENGYLISDT